MNDGDWEDLKEEICTFLAIGFENGEPELETITRLLWQERHKNVCLSDTLATAQREAAVNDERDQRAAGKVSNVLAWKPASRSGGCF